MLAIGLLYWAFTKIDIQKLGETLKTANYFWVGAAFLAGIASHVIRTIRWKMLIEPMGYKLNLKTGFYGVMTGYLVNIVTPRVGEFARCALVHETDKIPIDKLIGTVVTERIFDLIVTILITLAVVWFQMDLIGGFIHDLFMKNDGTTRIYQLIILVVIGAAGLGFYLLIRKFKNPSNQSPFIKKIFDFINGLLDGVKSIFKIKHPMLFVFYTLLIWFFYFLMSYVIFFALDSTSHLGVDAALTTLIMGTVAIIIPAPGGFGSFHYFVPLGLTLFNIDLDTGTAYATLSHTTQMVMIAVVGGISMILAGQIKKRKNLA